MLNPPQIILYRAKHFALKQIGQFMPLPKPTLYTGQGSSSELCKAIAFMGTKKILVVTDEMLVKIGLVDRIVSQLEKLSVSTVIYDGIQPDPTFEQVKGGIDMAKRHHCDAVLAVGGGSSIDAAKVISAGATNTKPIEKMIGVFKVRKACLPFYAIPTTSGTGSEATIGAVISNSVSHEKFLLLDPKLVPLMAALDSTLMTGLPSPITAATGMDALTHAIEAYISINASPDTDGYALMATRLIMENIMTAFNDGGNLEARHNMALASYYGGLALTKASLGYVHAISHGFGAHYHTPHGLGNAIVLPYVLEYSKDACIDRLADLAKVSGLKEGNESNTELANKFIARVRILNKDLGIPETLEALNASDIPAITKAALKEAHNFYPIPKFMDAQECSVLISKMLYRKQAAETTFVAQAV